MERHPYRQKELGRDATQVDKVKERDLHRQRGSGRDTHTDGGVRERHLQRQSESGRDTHIKRESRSRRLTDTGWVTHTNREKYTKGQSSARNRQAQAQRVTERERGEFP
jgi:hypothetical protein